MVTLSRYLFLRNCAVVSVAKTGGSLAGGLTLNFASLNVVADLLRGSTIHLAASAERLSILLAINPGQIIRTRLPSRESP